MDVSSVNLSHIIMLAKNSYAQEVSLSLSLSLYYVVNIQEVCSFLSSSIHYLRREDGVCSDGRVSGLINTRFLVLFSRKV